MIFTRFYIPQLPSHLLLNLRLRRLCDGVDRCHSGHRGRAAPGREDEGGGQTNLSTIGALIRSQDEPRMKQKSFKWNHLIPIVGTPIKGKAFWLFEVFAADQTLLSKVMPSGGSTHPRPGKRNKELMHLSKFLSNVSILLHSASELEFCSTWSWNGLCPDKISQKCVGDIDQVNCWCVGATCVRE